ncbi:type I-B CRISPR-associated protein Cas5b [Methanobrevibacter sp.]|uniref:type I-B CRISPR-associated protein Cas5b n=1 Tax=Methanobrevibacter sp. TaxID=66852 RepID=UPI0026DEF1B0|nr:type I-B CRISPR-associated protein Cas5b [Methanobrevibacter sp.]MDO5824551.1 type I-B CRISPR-associated protein Cas5b [Methanobrevibacter sp.]
MNKKLLAFDIWGDYGYFRRGYTSTSTITFPFPSRTTISGLISGILGLEKGSYHEIFNEDNSKIGLRILNPIKKININLNYINTKGGFLLSDINSNPRVQVQAEFLKDVKYRIYVSLNNDSLMEELYCNLSEHKSVFTPCLGISECIADFKLAYDDLFDLNMSNGNDVNIDSVILKNKFDLIIEPGKKYGIVKSPGFMNSDRIVSKFLEYYYEENANSIKVKNGDFYLIGDEKIALY